MWLTKAASAFRAGRQFSMKYTATHEWIRYDEKTKIGVIGISNYAQGQLGDIVHVSLPRINNKYKQNDPLATIESVKVVSDIYAPVDGVVIEINAELKKTPEVINEEAEGKGWLFKMKVDKSEEVVALLDDKGYEKVVADSAH